MFDWQQIIDNPSTSTMILSNHLKLKADWSPLEAKGDLAVRYWFFTPVPNNVSVFFKNVCTLYSLW